MARPSKVKSANPPTASGRQPGWAFLLYSVGASVVLAVIILLWAARHPVKSDAHETRTTHHAADTVSPDPKEIRESILKRVTKQGTGKNVDSVPIASLLDHLRNSSQSMAVRKEAARKLAEIGSIEAMEALKEVLENGPSQLKAAVAESLGTCPSPEALSMLLKLAGNADQPTARGALRGLAVKGGPDSLGMLSSVLFDETCAAEMRSEAALALGGMRQPEAVELLTKALGTIQNEVLMEHVLDGLGHRPFAETETVFREFLNRDDISGNVRRAAIEALGHTTDDATPFILSLAGDGDADVRTAAAWALAQSENPGVIGSQLVDWLKQENDSAVRLRLYQALVRQENFSSSDLLPLVRRETDAEARLAGLGLLADTVRASGESEAGRYFETSGVPELRNAVYNSSRLDQSLTAIMALGRAGTPSAVALLGEIATHPTDAALRNAAIQALKHNSTK